MTTPLDPRLNVVRPDYADARLEGLVAVPHFVHGRPATIREPVAAVRRRPASDAPLETEALFGERLLVFETGEEGWSFVQLEADRYVGWMETESFAAGTADGETLRVNVPLTFVFPGPDIKLPPLRTLPMGAAVRPRGEAEDRNASYVLVEPFGAVVRQHLAPSNEGAEDFVAVAERLLGAPYLWGGRSMLGMDCSGLVQLAGSMAGQAVPRDTDMQERWVVPVDREAPRRRGDLVFWPGHVGIMIDGDRLLHANAHHMRTAVEPLAEAVARNEGKGVAVSSVGRFPAA